MAGAVERLKVISIIIRLVLILFMIPALCSCGSDESGMIARVSRVAMGTLVEISAVGSPDRTKPAIEAAFDEIRRVENLTSFHKVSGLTQINDSSGETHVKSDAELVDLIRKSVRFSEYSDGAFDITIGSIGRLWNFSGELGPRLPDRSEIEKLLPTVGSKLLKIDSDQNLVFLPVKGMALDLGAIAKGYGLDRAAETLRRMGIGSGLVNAGGDIVAFGKKAPDKPWRIGIQDPRNPGGILAVGEINDRAVVTSGDYERFFMDADRRYHHILDPKTGYPAEGLQSVTIVAPDGVTADAMSTAVFVLGKDKGLALIETMPDVAGLVVDRHGSVFMSEKARHMFELKQ